MVDKPEKFACSKHSEKKAIMCCIDKACKEKLLCESCLLVHNFKSKHDENLYNVKVLKNKELITEVAKLVPTEVKELIDQLTQIHQEFAARLETLTEALSSAILHLAESSINVKQVEEQERLAHALFEEVTYSRTEENLVQYAEQFDRFSKIVKGIDVNAHKMRFNKLANLYKGLTNDMNNFINGKVADISGQTNRATVEIGGKGGQTVSLSGQGNQGVQGGHQSGQEKGGYGIGLNPGSSSTFEADKTPKETKERNFGGPEADLGHSRGTPSGRNLAVSQTGGLGDFLTTRLFNQPYTLDLIFKASDDGRTPQAFHKACDGVANTLVVAHVGNHTFGGYTDALWSSERIGTQKESKNSFLFSMNSRKKFYIKPDHTRNAIYCRQNCGPVFGKGGLDLFICNGPFSNNGGGPCSYESETQSFGFTSGEKYEEFEIDDFEVYAVNFR
jgi:hypothetical protein